MVIAVAFLLFAGVVLITLQRAAQLCSNPLGLGAGLILLTSAAAHLGHVAAELGPLLGRHGTEVGQVARVVFVCQLGVLDQLGQLGELNPATPPAGGGPQALGIGWPLAVVDGFSACIAVWYVFLRRHRRMLLGPAERRGTAPPLDAHRGTSQTLAGLSDATGAGRLRSRTTPTSTDTPDGPAPQGRAPSRAATAPVSCTGSGPPASRSMTSTSSRTTSRWRPDTSVVKPGSSRTS